MLPAPQKRQRFRSSSVSLTAAGRVESDEKMGVLKKVQIHARARHAFAPAETLALAKRRLLAEPFPQTAESDHACAPLLIRRNSTSSPLSPLMSPAPSSSPLPPPRSQGTSAQEGKRDEPIVDPAAPQTVAPPELPKESQDPILTRLAEISDNKTAIEYVRFMVNNHKDLTVEHFNAAFTTLLNTRASGEPLNAIIRLYNSMLERSVVPNVATYETLIIAFTNRDFEIQRAILSVDQKIKHVAFLSQDEVSTLDADKGRIERLRMEDNFPSAMSLFEGLLAIGGKQHLRLSTFIRLLRSCAYHSDVVSALHVFAQLETANHLKVNHLVYQHLILTFVNARRVEQCEETFNSYLADCKGGRLAQHKGSTAEVGRHHQIQVWNTMIEAYFRFDMPEKAVGLVDQMVSSSSTNSFAIDEIPVPTSSTFATVIAGFILNDDVKSALSWFDRLLDEEKAPINPFQGLDGEPMRPNSVAWHMMLDALAKAGMIDDLNRLYKLLRVIYKQDHINIRPVDRCIIHRANLDNLEKLSEEEARKTLDWLVEDLTQPPLPTMMERWSFMMDFCVEYIKRGEYVIPFNLLDKFISGKLEYIAGQANPPSDFQRLELQHTYLTACEALYLDLQQGKGELTWLPSWSIISLGVVLGLKPQARFAPYIIPAYSRARYVGEIAYDDFESGDWDVLLRLSAYLETNAARGNPDNLPPINDLSRLGGVSSILQDMASHGVDFEKFEKDIKVEVLQILEAQYGGEQGRTEFLKKLGASYADAAKDFDFDMLKFGALETVLSRPTSPLLQAESTSLSPSPTYASSSSFGDSESTLVSSSSSSGLMIHGLLTRSLTDLLDAPYHSGKLSQAYRLFEKNFLNKMVPEPSAIARLIQAFGRSGNLEKVRELYTISQDVFPLLDTTVQLGAWAHIEDSMIIALAHAGFPDAAHVHRLRILDQGLTPSADGYGVLIQHVKDTTDDTSGAMALFTEASERGVKMNLYLYNNIISKLSKARKADHALELFQQMKASYVTPSSITYGAVIGACARVGDVKSAEQLFQEMIHSRNFRPRVPPYNTMMQLHTTTKPNRTSALHYYNEMRRAGVQPSAHTYKVRSMCMSVYRFVNHFISFLSIPMVPSSLLTSSPWKTFSMNCKTTCPLN